MFGLGSPLNPLHWNWTGLVSVWKSILGCQYGHCAGSKLLTYLKSSPKVLIMPLDWYRLHKVRVKNPKPSESWLTKIPWFRRYSWENFTNRTTMCSSKCMLTLLNITYFFPSRYMGLSAANSPTGTHFLVLCGPACACICWPLLLDSWYSVWAVTHLSHHI